MFHGCRSGSTHAHQSLPDECGIIGHQWLTAKLVMITFVGGVIGLFGVFGNVSTIVIFNKPGMRTPNNMFLTALAAYDAVLLVTAFMLYAVEYVVELGRHQALHRAWLAYVRLTFMLSNVTQTGSVYITVAVTIERFIAVVLPRRFSQRLCHRQSAAASIAGVSLFSLLFNCTRYYEIKVVRNLACAEESWQGYVLLPGPLASNPVYQTVYSLYLTNIWLADWLSVLFSMVFIPFVLLSAGNCAIATTLARKVREGERRLFTDKRSLTTCREWTSREMAQMRKNSREETIVLIAIVCIFLICNFWGFVLAIVERVVQVDVLSREYHMFYAFSRETINFLAIVNASINFVIYCVFNADFRMHLLRTYAGCCYETKHRAETRVAWNAPFRTRLTSKPRRTRNPMRMLWLTGLTISRQQCKMSDVGYTVCTSPRPAHKPLEKPTGSLLGSVCCSPRFAQRRWLNYSLCEMRVPQPSVSSDDLGVYDYCDRVRHEYDRQQQSHGQQQHIVAFTCDCGRCECRAVIFV